MPVPGAYHRVQYGPPDVYVGGVLAGGGVSTFAMATLNTGWCARFTAPDTRDIKSIYLNWSAVTAAGTVRIRIETIDATTGKPSGTLYDANATKDITPAAGWQNYAFTTLPTAGLVAGAEYAIVLLTTVGGTTMTLSSNIPVGSYPTEVLTAADGTTRSNFAEVANGVPVLSVVFEDDSEEVLEFCPYVTVGSANIFGTNAAGLKFTVPTGLTIGFAGINAFMTRVGTPAGDLRIRIFNSADATVSGSTCTIDKDSITAWNTRRGKRYFPAVVSLAAGTYRVVFDSSSSANSSNCWRLSTAAARAAANVASAFRLTTTADVTAGTISWSDTAGTHPDVTLDVDSFSAAGAAFPVIGSSFINNGRLAI